MCGVARARELLGEILRLVFIDVTVVSAYIHSSSGMHMHHSVVTVVWQEPENYHTD
jgi:hypothetical protein